jgi:hypothetical protein
MPRCYTQEELLDGGIEKRESVELVQRRRFSYSRVVAEARGQFGNRKEEENLLLKALP